jgi:hypothetical protein
MAHPTEKNTGPWKKKMLFRAADGSIMTGTRPWDNTVVKLRIGIRNSDGKVARVAPNNWTPGANTRFEQLHGAAKVSSGTKRVAKKLTVKRKKPRKVTVAVSCDTLKTQYAAGKIKADIRDPTFQRLQRCISGESREAFAQQSADKYPYLYPDQEDPAFNVKIAKKKEFYDTRYEVRPASDFTASKVEEITNQLCGDPEFELDPHQMFVRNFMSFQTPYNGLLLYHGLGTGKTCSAISVCEEMRTYLKQLGATKKIIIVASPVVQENFKIQLFDERKLKDVNGLWNMKACTGNKFIQEVNPMNMKGLSRGRVIQQIKKIISQSYQFVGYLEFSNIIKKVMNMFVTKSDKDPSRIRDKQTRALRKEFSNRMIVIDEVHNIRVSSEGAVKASSEYLLEMVACVNNLKLLILSATPLFDSYQEAIWLVNLLNLNDKRYPVKEAEIFDPQGNFKIDKDGNEIGKELLAQKMTGYVSYVRGENPFTFPYRVWPQEARNPDSMKTLLRDNVWTYPSHQANGVAIVKPIELLDLLITNVGSYQLQAYAYILESLKKKNPRFEAGTGGMSYTVLEAPLQILNISYPSTRIGGDVDEDVAAGLVGGNGLERIMTHKDRVRAEFKYRDETLQEFGRIFSPEEIGKYSGKIDYIISRIRRSKGIVIVYSQYIDAGVIPMALSLEELGFKRYGHASRSLFATPPSGVQPIDALTMKPKTKGQPFTQATYIMITGDKALTGNIKDELKAATDAHNINGEVVKVIIISRAGSEGLDFKNVRQMHIMDPWYNLNREEQIIGRAVRNFSHCDLPYRERNVEIFLYGSRLQTDTEAIDLYLYRLAERKARKVAIVTRALKEIAVDCLLNRRGLDFSSDLLNSVVDQELSSGVVIKYRLGDKDNSALCDFTTCQYTCKPTNDEPEEIGTDTYDETFIVMNMDKILQRIRLLFKERYIYNKPDLIAGITVFKHYPHDQIYSALTYLISEKNEYITDMLGRMGRLVNIGEYYMFQPVEIEDDHISRYDRVHPVDYKRKSLVFKVPTAIKPHTETSGTKEGKVSLAGVTTASIFRKLAVAYSRLSTPGAIASEDKEEWTMAAAWAIRSLTTHDNMDGQELMTLAMHHVIDVLPYAEKLALLKSSESVPTDIAPYVRSFFAAFGIESDGHRGVIIADFDREKGLPPFQLIENQGGKWNPVQVILAGEWGEALQKKLIVDVDLINTLIGFMTLFRGFDIVYKTKDIRLSDKGRTNKGQRCDRGERKKGLIARINMLLGGGTKYTLFRSTISKIYGKDATISPQTVGGKGNVTAVPINALQLCAETELIFRYYDSKRKDGKRWFFSTVEAVLNNIEKLGRKN